MQFPISTHVPLHNSMMFSMNPALSEPNLITFAQMQQNNLQACLSQMNHVSKKSSKKSSDLLKEDKKKV